MSDYAIIALPIMIVLLLIVGICINSYYNGINIDISQRLSQMSCGELKTYINESIKHDGDPTLVNTHGKMMYYTDPEKATQLYNANCLH